MSSFKPILIFSQIVDSNTSYDTDFILLQILKLRTCHYCNAVLPASSKIVQSCSLDLHVLILPATLCSCPQRIYVTENDPDNFRADRVQGWSERLKANCGALLFQFDNHLRVSEHFTLKAEVRPYSVPIN